MASIVTGWFRGQKTLEAQVFLKHKEVFETLKDCSHVLRNFRECYLINENQARKINSVVDKSKRNR